MELRLGSNPDVVEGNLELLTSTTKKLGIERLSSHQTWISKAYSHNYSLGHMDSLPGCRHIHTREPIYHHLDRIHAY